MKPLASRYLLLVLVCGLLTPGCASNRTRTARVPEINALNGDAVVVEKQVPLKPNEEGYLGNFGAFLYVNFVCAMQAISTH